MSKSPVAEIVTFRLNKGANPQEFTRAARALLPFLHETGAMTARTLSCDPDGLWTDHITWGSLDAAKSAAASMVERPEAAPFMQMIDPVGMTMRHAPIVLDTPPE